jgi:hypothetical protein
MHGHGVSALIDMIPVDKHLFLNRFFVQRLHIVSRV